MLAVKTKPTKNCLKCGELFIVKPYLINRAKYCSRLCQNRSIKVGKKNSEESIRKRDLSLIEAKKRLSKNCLGCGMSYSSPQSRNRLYCSHLCYGNSKVGSKATLQTRLKLSESHKGEKSYLWRGGITSENRKIRDSIEYRLWREAVFARDNFTCQECNERGGILNADHIKPFALFPELRLAIDNGRTLCKSCHIKTPTWGSNSKPK